MPGFLILMVNFIFSVSAFNCTEHQLEITAVEGQAAMLLCDSALDSETLTFTWTKDNRTLDPSPQIKIQGQILWFLNVTLSDVGLYICRSANSTFSKKTLIFLSIETGPCPSPYNVKLTQEKNNINLSCAEHMKHILGQRMEIQWWKDCRSMGIQSSELKLSNVTMNEEGNYTCLVVFSYENKNYTISRTHWLVVLKKEPVNEPRVIQPRNETLHVKPGVGLTLECIVFIGFGKESQQETFVYWMINYTYVETYPEIQQNMTIEMRENSWMYGTLTLFIPQVLPVFFDVPFQCVIFNPIGDDMGQVWIRQDDKTNHTWLIIVLFLISAVAVGVILYVFRIDLILAYRHLCRKENTTQEENLYNACVFYLHGKSPGSATAEDLALRIIPAMLEQQNNLKLFIHGRDTETNVSDTNITNVLNQSKTVVLILPGNNSDETLIPFGQGQNRLEDTQLSVLFSHIAHFGVPFLVVEGEENADYSLLPDSIRSSIKKEKVLKWKPTVQHDGRFWKQLKYQMT